MDFKFKEVVEESIIYFYEHVLSRNEYTEDVFDELDRVYVQASKADEYEVKNKELLEELKYLRKVTDDLVWQRDTDEEYEAKAKAFDHIENLVKTELTSDDLYNDARNNDYVAGMLRVYETVDYIIEEYESGEYDAEK